MSTASDIWKALPGEGGTFGALLVAESSTCRLWRETDNSVTVEVLTEKGWVVLFNKEMEET